MAASAGYSISISAVDKTSAVLGRINAKIAGSQTSINKRLEAASAPMKRMQTQLNRTMSLLGGGKLASGVGDVSKRFQGLTRSSFSAFNNISRLVDPLAVIGSATTVAGVAALERRFASLGQTLTNTGRLMNMDPAKIAQWEGAVKLTGGSAGDADSSLRGLTYSVGDALAGRNNAAAGMLQQIEGPNWRGKSQDINGTTMAISGFLSKLKGVQRATAIRNIQGDFGFSDGFMSMLLRGPQAVQGLLKQSAAHGSMTDSQIGAGDSLAKSLNAAQQSIEGVANALTSKLAGPLQKITDAFSKWTDANRNLISQHIAQIIEDIGRRVAAFNPKPLEEFAARMDRLVKSTLGWQKAIEGGIGILVASKVAGIALPFVRLADAIGILSGGGPKSFGALGAALRAIGFGVVGGQLVKLAADAAGAPRGLSDILGDATTGAFIGSRFGPLGAMIGAAAGAAIAGIAEPAPSYKSAELPDDIKAQVASEAKRQGVPVDFALAQFEAEGGGYNRVSSAGAIGPAQLMPGTARDLGVAGDIHDKNYSWQDNVKAGVQYEKMLLAHYNGNRYLAAAAYNWGPGAVDKWVATGQGPRDLPAETQRYIATMRANGGMPASGTPSIAPPDTDARGHRIVHPSDAIGQGGPSGMGREDRLAVDVTVHQGRVTGVKAHHSAKHATTTVRTAMPMPAGGP